MSHENWWNPRTLSDSQHEFRRISEVRDLDRKNDFGSYRRVLLGDSIENSGIELHNDLNPLDKVRSIAKLVPNEKGQVILDAGCGLGFTTVALAQVFPESTLTGIDLSIDAIKFATNNHTGITFIAKAIEPAPDVIGSYDLIFCFEFYPFTRNSDVKFQSEMIKFLARNLKSNGTLVIAQTWREPHGLHKILKSVEESCNELRFVVRKTPHPRISTRLSWPLALISSAFGQLITRRELLKNVILVKNDQVR